MTGRDTPSLLERLRAPHTAYLRIGDLRKLHSEAAAEIIDLKSALDTSRLCTQERDRRCQELERQLSEIVPAGWKLVPIEPTQAMLAVGNEASMSVEALLGSPFSVPRSTWKAMLASAPEAQK
jgi:hypothetical protein